MLVNTKDASKLADIAHDFDFLKEYHNHFK